MFAFRHVLAPLLASAALLAPAASASGIEISFGKHSKHGSFGVTYSGGERGYQRDSSFCPPPRVWTPGHYETRCERVWVEGAREQVWVPARYEWRHDSCGRAYQVCVSPGYWRTVCAPGHYEARQVRVWVEGCWR